VYDFAVLKRVTSARSVIRAVHCTFQLTAPPDKYMFTQFVFVAL
jgi:hypothetical protein